MNLSTRYLADLGERAGRSFIQGFFGLWLANPNQPIEFDTLFTLSNLKAGVVMAALSIGMALVGKPVGNPDSASVLPPQAQPPAPQPPDPTLTTWPTTEDQWSAALDLARKIQPLVTPPAPAPPPPLPVAAPLPRVSLAAPPPVVAAVYSARVDKWDLVYLRPAPAGVGTFVLTAGVHNGLPVAEQRAGGPLAPVGPEAQAAMGLRDVAAAPDAEGN